MVSECANLSSGIHGWRSISCAPEYIVFASLDIQVYLTRAYLCPFASNCSHWIVFRCGLAQSLYAAQQRQSADGRTYLNTPRLWPRSIGHFRSSTTFLDLKRKKKFVLSLCCRHCTFSSISLPHPCEFLLFPTAQIRWDSQQRLPML